MPNKRDVFLCHASEDKPTYLRPLIKALDKAGITYWYDEAEITWGDSITQKVNYGLTISRYVIVLISESFLSKNWPKRELNAALNLEAASGEIRVLPILANSSLRRKLEEDFPLISDKLYLIWDNPDHVVAELQKRLGKGTISNGVSHIQDIPLPQIHRKITQRDKDIFLRKAYRSIVDYFKAGLNRIRQQYPEIEIDMEIVDNRTHEFRIYSLGERIGECRIWIGGYGGSGICYYEGQLGYSKNSYNELLIVDTDGRQLGLKATMGSVFEDVKKELMTADETAIYLWSRFMKCLQK